MDKPIGFLGRMMTRSKTPAGTIEQRLGDRGDTIQGAAMRPGSNSKPSNTVKKVVLRVQPIKDKSHSAPDDPAPVEPAEPTTFLAAPRANSAAPASAATSIPSPTAIATPPPVTSATPLPAASATPQPATPTSPLPASHATFLPAVPATLPPAAPATLLPAVPATAVPPTRGATPASRHVSLEVEEDESVALHRAKDKLPSSSASILEESADSPVVESGNSKYDPLFDPRLEDSHDENASNNHRSMLDAPIHPAAAPTVKDVLGSNVDSDLSTGISTDIGKIIGAPDDDEDEDEDEDDGTPKEPLAPGPLSQSDLDEVLAAVSTLDSILLSVARRARKTLSYIYRIAMPHLKLSRKPNLFNLFVKHWCYHNKKGPDESFHDLRERFVAAYHEKVDDLDVKGRKDLRKELLKWSEAFDKAHAKKVQEDGDLYKIMLQARLEFEVLAQYYYRFYDIGVFGWVVSTRPGDVVASQANSTFASTKAAAKWMDQMGSSIPAAMDQFSSVMKVHKTAEIKMDDWSLEAERKIVPASGAVIKPRVSTFLKEFQATVTGKRHAQVQWKNFSIALVDARVVITNWPRGVSFVDESKSIFCDISSLRKLATRIFKMKRGEAGDYQIGFRKMTREEKQLAKSKSTSAEWKKVPIYEDTHAQAVLTVGDTLREMKGHKLPKHSCPSPESDSDCYIDPDNSKLKSSGRKSKAPKSRAQVSDNDSDSEDSDLEDLPPISHKKRRVRAETSDDTDGDDESDEPKPPQRKRHKSRAKSIPVKEPLHRKSGGTSRKHAGQVRKPEHSHARKAHSARGPGPAPAPKRPYPGYTDVDSESDHRSKKRSRSGSVSGKSRRSRSAHTSRSPSPVASTSQRTTAGSRQPRALAKAKSALPTPQVGGGNTDGSFPFDISNGNDFFLPTDKLPESFGAPSLLGGQSAFTPAYDGGLDGVSNTESFKFTFEDQTSTPGSLLDLEHPFEHRASSSDTAPSAQPATSLAPLNMHSLVPDPTPPIPSFAQDPIPVPVAVSSAGPTLPSLPMHQTPSLSPPPPQPPSSLADTAARAHTGAPLPFSALDAPVQGHAVPMPAFGPSQIFHPPAQVPHMYFPPPGFSSYDSLGQTQYPVVHNYPPPMPYYMPPPPAPYPPASTQYMPHPPHHMYAPTAYPPPSQPHNPSS